MGLVLANNIALAQDEELSFAPRIGVNSVFRASEATVTASSETAGGEHENAWKEGTTYDFWRPDAAGEQWLRAQLSSSMTANYLAIAAHNLHQVQGSVKAQYSTDGISWTDLHAAVSPPNSQPLMVLFSDVESSNFRLLVNSVDPVAIGVVYIGAVTRLRVPIHVPWTPPYLARSNRYVNEESEGGQFLGSSLIAEGAELQLDLQDVPMEWVRDVWEPVVREIEQYPFFFAARDVAAEGGLQEAEVFYGWRIRQPTSRYTKAMHGQVSLRARGIIS